MSDNEAQVLHDHTNRMEKAVRPTHMDLPGGPSDWGSTPPAKRSPSLSSVMLSPGSTTQKLIAAGKIKNCFILLEKTSLEQSRFVDRDDPLELDAETADVKIEPVNTDAESTRDTVESCQQTDVEATNNLYVGLSEISRYEQVSSRSDGASDSLEINRNVFTSFLRDWSVKTVEDSTEAVNLHADKSSGHDDVDIDPTLMSDCSESEQITRTDFEDRFIEPDRNGNTYSVNYDVESISSTGSSETIEYSEAVPDIQEVYGEHYNINGDEEPSDEPPCLESLESWPDQGYCFNDYSLLSPPLLTSIMENPKNQLPLFVSESSQTRNALMAISNRQSPLSKKAGQAKTHENQNTEDPLVVLESSEHGETLTANSNQQLQLSGNIEESKTIRTAKHPPVVSKSSEHKNVLTANSNQKRELSDNVEVHCVITTPGIVARSEISSPILVVTESEPKQHGTGMSLSDLDQYPDDELVLKQPMPTGITNTKDVEHCPVTTLDTSPNKEVSSVLPSKGDENRASPPSEGVQSNDVLRIKSPVTVTTSPTERNENSSAITVAGSKWSETIVNDVFFANSSFVADTATNSAKTYRENSSDSTDASPSDDQCVEAEYQDILRQIAQKECESSPSNEDLIFSEVMSSTGHVEDIHSTESVALPTTIQEEPREQQNSNADIVTEALAYVEVASSQCPEVCDFISKGTVDVCDYESINSSVSDVNSEIERAVASISGHGQSVGNREADYFENCFQTNTSDRGDGEYQGTEPVDEGSSTVGVIRSGDQREPIDAEKGKIFGDNLKDKMSMIDQDVKDDSRDNDANNSLALHSNPVMHSEDAGKPTSTAIEQESTHSLSNDLEQNSSNKNTHITVPIADSETSEQSPIDEILADQQREGSPVDNKRERDHMSRTGDAETVGKIVDSVNKPRLDSLPIHEEDICESRRAEGGSPSSDNQESLSKKSPDEKHDGSSHYPAVDDQSEGEVLQSSADKTNPPNADLLNRKNGESSNFAESDIDSRTREIDTAISLAFMSAMTTPSPKAAPNEQISETIRLSENQKPVESSSQSSLTPTAQGDTGPGGIKIIHPVGSIIPDVIHSNVYTQQSKSSKSSGVFQGAVYHTETPWSQPAMARKAKGPGRGRYQPNFTVVDYPDSGPEKSGPFKELRHCLAQEQSLQPDPKQQTTTPPQAYRQALSDQVLMGPQQEWSASKSKCLPKDVRTGVPIEFPGGKRFIAYHKEALNYVPSINLADPANQPFGPRGPTVPPQLPQNVSHNSQPSRSTTGGFPAQQLNQTALINQPNLSSVSRPPMHTMHAQLMPQQHPPVYVNFVDRTGKGLVVYPHQEPSHSLQYAPVDANRIDQSLGQIIQPPLSVPNDNSLAKCDKQHNQAGEKLRPTPPLTIRQPAQFHGVGPRGELSGAVVDRGQLTTSANNQAVDHLTRSFQTQQQLFYLARGYADHTNLDDKQPQHQVNSIPSSHITMPSNVPQEHMMSSDIVHLQSNFNQVNRPAPAVMDGSASEFIGNLAETSRRRSMNQNSFTTRDSPCHMPRQADAVHITTGNINGRLQSEHPHRDVYRRGNQITPLSENPPAEHREVTLSRPESLGHAPLTSNPNQTWTPTEQALLKSVPVDLAKYLIDQCMHGVTFRDTLTTIVDSLQEEENREEAEMRVWSHTNVLHNRTQQASSNGDASYPNASKKSNNPSNVEHPAVLAESRTTPETHPSAPTLQHYRTQPQQHAVSLTTDFSRSTGTTVEAIDVNQYGHDLESIRKNERFYNPAPPVTPLLEEDNIHRKRQDDTSLPAQTEILNSEGSCNLAIDLSIRPTRNSQCNPQTAVDVGEAHLNDTCYSQHTNDVDHYEGRPPLPYSLSNSRLCHRVYTAGEQGPIRASSLVDLSSQKMLTSTTQFMDTNLSPTQLLIRSKLLERRSRIQGMSISTPDILHSYESPAKRKRKRLLDSNYQTDNVLPTSNPTKPQCDVSSDERHDIDGENPLVILTSPHSAKAIIGVGDAAQRTRQFKDTVNFTTFRDRTSRESVLEPDLTAQYPRMKSNIQGKWFSVSVQPPAESCDSQQEHQVRDNYRKQASTSNASEHYTVLQSQPVDQVTCSEVSYLPDTSAVRTSRLRAEAASVPNKTVIEKLKRKKGRPKGSGSLKKFKESTNISSPDLECQFCSFKSCFRSEIRAHTKYDHFAKFQKKGGTSSGAADKKVSQGIKLVANTVGAQLTLPVQPSQYTNVKVTSGTTEALNKGITVCPKTNNAPHLIESSDSSNIGAAATPVDKVLVGNQSAVHHEGSYIANAPITSDITSTAKTANPQVAVSPSPQQQIPQAQAIYIQQQTSDTQAAEANMSAVVSSTERPSLHERLKQTPYRCAHCKQYCDSSKDLLIHIKFRHTNTKGLHMCFNCGYTAKSKYQLRKHILKWHFQSQKTENRCTRLDCGEVFATQDQLQSHLQLHDVERNYVCNLCGAKYQHLTGLRYHKQRHELNYPHQCKVCGLKFKSLGMLNRHEFQKNHISS